MCFLVVHHRVHAEAPLVLLATRDERYDRPFDAPHAWRDVPHVFAPRDREAGGTWIGTNDHGLVVALTNRGRPRPDLGARSRGLLVRDALAQESASAAWAAVRKDVAEAAYEGFHLLLADRDEAHVLQWDAGPAGRRPAERDHHAWGGGSHTLSSLHDPDEVEVPPEAAPGAASLDAWLERLEGLARDDAPRLPGGHRILKRAPDGRRGTVCAALVVLPRLPGAPAAWRFAAGPPDRVPFLAVPRA
jgi:hypothetical protein